MLNTKMDEEGNSWVNSENFLSLFYDSMDVLIQVYNKVLFIIAQKKFGLSL
jgi:hypothetical protein